MTTTIIDLETDTLPKEKNIQEALKLKRPDYIAKTKNREQDRLARSMVNNSNKQGTIGSSTSVKYSKQTADILPSKVKGSAFRAKSVYDPPLASNNTSGGGGGVKKSKIPTSSKANNAGSPGSERPTSAAAEQQQNGGKIQNGHHPRNSETVTLVSRPRPSITCQDVRRSANAANSGGGSASEGQTNAKKMALNRSRAIKASQ